ncbi:MAG: cupredoxin domain-containing protein [Gemmatimonadota bacterium]
MRTILTMLPGLACLACGQPAQEAAPDQTLTLDAVSYAYQPAQLSAEPGTIRFVVRNVADEEHGFEVEGQGVEEEIESIPGGATDSLAVTLTTPGEYEIYCPVDDHAERGMRGTLTIAAGAGAAR